MKSGIVKLILLAGGCLLAGASGYSSALAYYRAHADGNVPALFADDPFIVLARGEADMLAPERGLPDLSAMEQAAKAVLREEPLNPQAIFMLGAVRSLKGEGDGAREYLLAEQVSRRHVPNELALVHYYARRGDVPGVVRSFDRVFSVSPELVATYLPGLIDTLGDPQTLRAFLPYAGRPWFLSMVGLALDQKLPSSVVGPLLDAAEHQPAVEEWRISIIENLRIRLLSNMLTAKDYEAVNMQVQRLPQVNRDALGQLGFLPANTDPALAPLAWTLANDNEKSAALEHDGSLDVSVGAEQTGVVAERMTVLKPGLFRITQRLTYSDTDPKAILTWDVVCEGQDGVSLWHQTVPARAGRTTYQSSLTVPQTCPVQHWWLKATGDIGQSASVVSLEALSAVAQ